MTSEMRDTGIERSGLNKVDVSSEAIINVAGNRILLGEESRRVLKAQHLMRDLPLTLVDCSGHEITEKRPLPPRPESDAAVELLSQRKHLLSLTKAHGEDTNEFVKRMDQLQARVPKDLSAEEVTNTYKQLSRLLEPPSTIVPETSGKERATLARQILTQAAQPNLISQGDHNSCSVAAIESVVYTRHPSKAALMLADLALTGRFVAADMTNLELDPHPRDFDNQYALTGDGQRSYASELFQVAAANLHYKRIDVDANLDYRFEQVYVPGGARRTDSGEGLYLYADGKRMKVCDYPLLPKYAFHGVENAITGAQEKDHRLDNIRSLTPEQMGMDAVERGVRVFETEGEFEEQLARIKAANDFPIILGVNAANDPFVSEAPGLTAAPGGAHVVTIRDYIPGTPAKVLIDNEWSQDCNHDTPKTALTVHQLYLATFEPQDSANLLQKDIDDAHKKGHSNFYGEFESLRLKWVSGKLTGDQFKSRLLDTVDNFSRECHTGKWDREATFKAAKKLDVIVNALPSRLSVRVASEEYADGLILKKDFAGYVSRFGEDLNKRLRNAKWNQCLELAADELLLQSFSNQLAHAPKKKQ